MSTYSFIKVSTRLLFYNFSQLVPLTARTTVSFIVCAHVYKQLAAQLPFLLLSVSCPAMVSEDYCLSNDWVLEVQLPFDRVTLTVDDNDGAQKSQFVYGGFRRGAASRGDSSAGIIKNWLA